MRALAIAATGISAQEQNLEVIANDVANINTTGFKRSRAEFTDLIYQTERLMGVSNRGRDATIPEGAQIGLGVRTAAIRSVNLQGALTNTGNTLDLAINGRGWFQVTTANGDTVYTRDGAFNTNQNGQLVTMDGYTVTPSILVPANATNLTSSQTGLVTITLPSRRSAATTSSRPRPQASRPPAFRATPRSVSCSKATSKLPTSIPSPKSPISSRPSAPMK